MKVNNENFLNENQEKISKNINCILYEPNNIYHFLQKKKNIID